MTPYPRHLLKLRYLEAQTVPHTPPYIRPSDVREGAVAAKLCLTMGRAMKTTQQTMMKAAKVIVMGKVTDKEELQGPGGGSHKSLVVKM